MGKLSPLLFLGLALVAALVIWNENTAQGDLYRHRPLWLAPLTALAPVLDKLVLKREWFLRGGESETTREGLDVLLDSLNTEAELTPMGKIMAAFILRDQLMSRQCVAHPMKPLPVDRNVSEAIVILGLPRTGTSFLHNMLARDSNGAAAQFRTAKFHEYMDPCPRFADEHSAAGQVRIAVQRAKLWFTGKLVPKIMLGMHRMQSATKPEEDVVPLGQYLVSVMYPTSFHVPKYQKWLQEAATRSTAGSNKYREALEYLRYFLNRHAQQGVADGDNRRWLLKTPGHLMQLGELIEVIQPKLIIWTHRDPVEQAESLISTVLHMVGMGSDQVKNEEKRREIARETMEFWYWALQRGVDARIAATNVQFVDVNNKALRNNAPGMKRAIYAKLGLAMEKEAEAKVMVESDGAVEKYESLAAFGIDADALRQRYAQILSKLNLEFMGE